MLIFRNFLDYCHICSFVLRQLDFKGMNLTYKSSDAAVIFLKADGNRRKIYALLYTVLILCLPIWDMQQSQVPREAFRLHMETDTENVHCSIVSRSEKLEPNSMPSAEWVNCSVFIKWSMRVNELSVLAWVEL